MNMNYFYYFFAKNYTVCKKNIFVEKFNLKYILLEQLRE